MTKLCVKQLRKLSLTTSKVLYYMLVIVGKYSYVDFESEIAFENLIFVAQERAPA